MSKRLEILGAVLGVAVIVTGFGVWCGALQSHLWALNDDVRQLTTKLDDLPEGDKHALDALRAMRDQRDLVTSMLQDRAWTIANTILFSGPSPVQLRNVSELQTQAAIAAKLYEDAGRAAPPIYEIIAVLDKVLPSSGEGSEAVAARAMLVEMQAAAPKTQALANLLLAVGQMPERVDDATAQLREQIRFANLVLESYPYTAAAENVVVTSTIFLNEKEFGQGKKGADQYLSAFGAAWPRYRYVQQFDETLVGRFKYLNNSAYTLSIALLWTIPNGNNDGRQPIDKTSLATAIGLKTPTDVLRELTLLVERLLETGVDPEGSFRTAAQVYTSLGTFCAEPANMAEIGRCDWLKEERDLGADYFYGKAVEFYQRAAGISPDKYTDVKRSEDVEVEHFFRTLPPRHKEMVKSGRA